jgi:tetratricopeptide (TPR) repeat protein
VPEALAWLDQQTPEAGRDHWLRVSRALLLAMLGRFDEARPILAETRAELTQRGAGIRLAVTTAIESVNFELLAGDPAAAAELGAAGCSLLEQLGDKGFLSTAAGCLGQALYGLDRLDEADAWAVRAAELGASEDAATQVLWRQVRAKVLARRGHHIEAERVARDAVAIGEPTDNLNTKADASADLASVLEMAGRHEEAVAEMGRARRLYEQKGNIVSAGRALAGSIDRSG